MNAQQKWQLIENAVKTTLRNLPGELGLEIVRYSNQRFREQNWDGTPWRKRKNPNSKQNKGRALLVKSGRLKRSIKVIGTTPTSVTVGSDVPYAAIHNNGEKSNQTVKEHTRTVNYKQKFSTIATKQQTVSKQSYTAKIPSFIRRVRMPQRQFLGDSPYLRKGLLRITEARFKQSLKGLIKFK